LPDQANRTEKTETITVQTSRFGEVEVPVSQVLHFPQGLLGFPVDRYFVLLRHRPDSPFLWLQSLANPHLAFVITNPFQIVPEYQVQLTNEDRRDLDPAGDDPLLTYALVNIPRGNPAAMTMNLIGPLVVNGRTRVGKQVVLSDSMYSHRQPVLAVPRAESPVAPESAGMAAPP
jgi:flagellar assembly factor FliW